MTISIVSPILIASPFVLSPTVTTPSVVPTATLLPDKTWQFDWIIEGKVKIVYYGRILATTAAKTYIFDLPGQYSLSPPPLEIIAVNEFAITELAKPFVTIQWFRIPSVTRYEIKKFAGTTWKTVFKISNIESQVYTYNSEILPNGSTHKYKLLAYNDVDAVTESQEYNYTIACPSTVFEPNIVVDYVAGNIEITFKS